MTNPAVVVINEAGSAAGVAVAEALSGTLYVPAQLSVSARSAVAYLELPAELIARLFRAGQGLVLVMAVGIAVRFISGLPMDKRADPPVVVLDTAARYAISLLSGHEGGANALAYRVAAVVGAEPVVTTGSEGQRTLTLGLGCRRGVGAPRIMEAVERGLAMVGRDKNSIRVAATADFKAHEAGLHRACAELGVGLRFFDREAIRSVDRLFGESRCARKFFNVGGVAEPCAFLAVHNGRIILPRLVADEVTVALAEDRLWSPGSGRATPSI
ncbi:MAG: cobalamin biosynthesis protein [Eubacteriales bacterium]|jgi:cobalt-precorrin 5A hydrolase|nr:cobalamin biosynthesis protein [Pseudomonadota bacterium]MBU4532566.1 cobalamin biosynthesis protein [Bacillota bacterium]MBV1728511.1 cobalamin biosynthesis protein [Desulforudis sp.]MDZ4042582.1 cobalamin biosynthesis protein [Eubacteriales bacterium]MBU4553774.1 cobalamin biosynthesis protein [Bacillota bacterium]